MCAKMIEMIISSMIGGIFGAMIANVVWRHYIVKRLDKWKDGIVK